MSLAEGVSARVSCKKYASGVIAANTEPAPATGSRRNWRTDPPPRVFNAETRQGHLSVQRGSLGQADRGFSPRHSPRQRLDHQAS